MGIALTLALMLAVVLGVAAAENEKIKEVVAIGIAAAVVVAFLNISCYPRVNTCMLALSQAVRWWYTAFAKSLAEGHHRCGFIMV